MSIDKTSLQGLLEEAKRTIEIYTRDNDISPTSDWYILKLHEEIGELTQALLKKTKRSRIKIHRTEEQLHASLEDEVADALGYLLLFADSQNIDLISAARRKWFQEG